MKLYIAIEVHLYFTLKQDFCALDDFGISSFG